MITIAVPDTMASRVAPDGRRACGLCLTAKGAALVRNPNRKIRRRDTQFAAPLATRACKELLRLLAKPTDRQE